MKKDDVRVTVEDGILSVSGAKPRRKIRKRNSIASSDPLALSDAASRCLEDADSTKVTAEFPRRRAESASPDDTGSKIKSYAS